MKFASAIFTAIAAASSVAAHATFQELWVNGVDQAGNCVNKPTSNSPITDPNGASIACNTFTPATAKCAVPAGATVDVEMHEQPSTRKCGTDSAIGGQHDGPVIIYMAKVDNSLTAQGTSANWFKVAELGLIRTDYWGTDSLNDNCGRAAFKVPECIPAGDYLIRAEVIALHVASSAGGAQFYASCFPITVSGGGSLLPSNTVKFPGAYKATDPGILFNLHGTYSSYTIPGPAVWNCGAGGITTTAGPSPTSNAPSTPTTTSVPTTPGAVLWAQCGGIGWTGATTCASGTCKKQNDYYSQCAP